MKMLRALCGDAALANLMIVTTMWDTVPANIAEARFLELQSHENIAPMIAKGAQLKKHTGTPSSAHTLLGWFLGKKAPILQIQRELATGKKGILSTTAGAELEQEMAASEGRFRRQLADLTKEIGAAGASTDSRVAEELAKTRQELTANIGQLQRDRERLLKGQKQELKRAKKDVRKAEHDLERVRARNSRQAKKPSAFVALIHKLFCMSARHMEGAGVAPGRIGTDASSKALVDKPPTTGALSLI